MDANYEHIKQEVMDFSEEASIEDIKIEPTVLVFNDFKKENEDIFGVNESNVKSYTDGTSGPPENKDITNIENGEKVPVNKKPKIETENEYIHAGPSRFDPELLRDAILNENRPLKWFDLYSENQKVERTNSSSNAEVQDVKIERTDSSSNEEVQDVVVKQEISDDPAEEITNYHQTELENCGSTDIKKEDSGEMPSSLMNESQIKKEKMDDETFMNEKESSYNETLVKKEFDDTTTDFSDSADDKNLMPEPKRFKAESNDTKNYHKTFLFDKLKLGYIKICALCDMYTERSLKAHVDEQHQIEIFFSCPFCDYSAIVGSNALSKELHKHRKIITMFCEWCGDKFRTSLDLYMHSYEKHKEKMSTKCTICPYEAESYPCLIEHLLDCHNGQTFIHRCQHCKFVTMRPALMNLHMKMKHPIVPTNPEHIMKPISSTNQSQPKKKMLKKCPLCDYQSYHRLRNHFKIHHKDA